jgi:glucan phosphoethanolaminetransferase (alkaline phosphatase superfamily)
MTGFEKTSGPAARTGGAGDPATGKASRTLFAAWKSPAIWSRIAVGFAALCLVKIILLIALRKQLFEIHWRVSDEAPTWLNSFAFYLFGVLAGLNLWKLATRCMPAGARVVRAANICVLFLCSLFVFLTFHAGDKNYLFAVMNDILTWKSLGWYLYTDSCFQMPFLAAWLFGYALVYYGFWSKGREHLMLRVTAIFAAAYILVCLRDLREYRNALVIADCLGIGCLVLNGAGTLNPTFMALPLIGAGSLFVLFRPFQSALGVMNMNAEFSVLLWGILILLTGVTLMAWRRGFLAGWWRILPFVIASFLLVNNNYPAYPNLENLLCMGFMLPRYFLGEFGVMVALLVVAGLYRKFRPAGTLLWLDAANLLLITIALADLRLTQIMSVRLDYDVISLAAGETTKMMWRMSQLYLPSLGLALLVITALYALSLWAIRRTHRQPVEGSPSRGRSLAFAVIACLLLGVSGINLAPGDKAEGQTLVRFAETSPLLKRSATPVMDRATFVKTATGLGMTSMCVPTPSVAAHPRRNLNVIVIFQESTYNKHLSLFGSKEDTQPLLSQYQDRMELFPNFFSAFAGSMNARFATFTGLYPLGDYHAFTAERVPVKSIFEALHENGYTCSMFYSSFFDYTDFRDFLRNRDLDGMYDADTMPGTRQNKPLSWGLQEEETLDAMRQQIKTYAANKQKFFLTYVPAAPHNPFDGTPRRFQKKQREKVGDLTPLYINELLYMDWTISSLIDQLKESGLLDKTMVVITADHGEMLGDDGGPVGHGWALTPELANVPLIIMDPDHPGYRLNHTIGSQVDLMPTILDSLGIALPTGQLYQGASLYSPNLNTNRTIYLNTFRQYGFIEGANFISGDRETDNGGSTSSRQVFEITNAGSHTVFVPSTRKAQFDPSILSFDNFQKNVLRNYSAYSAFSASP